MSLTIGTGPLGNESNGVFNVELPDRRGIFYLEPSPRWIRGIAGDETIVDSRDARLLHEYGRLPIYHFPLADVRTDLLEPSGRRTRSPLVGEARWWTLRVGDRAVESAAWSYPDPLPEARGLADLIAFVWGAMDRWLEEEDEVLIHARDPYHRIDVVDTSRRVRVSIDGERVAETTRARVLFETSLPPRWYIPRDDVGAELLASEKRTGCAYKGYADHFSVPVGGGLAEDIAWSYPDPLPEAERVAGYIAFYDERTDVEIDGELQRRPYTPFHPDWEWPKPERLAAVAGAHQT